MTAVITGMGLFTPAGRGVADTFDALLTGRSGLRRPPEGHRRRAAWRWPGCCRTSTRAASPPDRDGGARPGGAARPDHRRRGTADAGIEVGRDVDPERIAVIVGGVGGMSTLEGQVLARAARGRAAVSPYLLTGILPNMPSARIAIAHGIRGYSSSVGTACASGAQAVADGVRLIRAGEADVVVCGRARRRCSARSPTRSANARALARAGTNRPRRAARSTSGATVSCWPRARRCWCWSAPATPTAGACAATPRSPVSGRTPTRTTRPRLDRTVPARRRCTPGPGGRRGRARRRRVRQRARHRHQAR
ncbi:beta-ketoacyl synthase N-terminal-like domain-containing protein [Micromonospora sp. BRA006-A]|nr:beta-ketoacyl synthase N-terminal-like domain-containing protein [Micromonospora sp. BRA006-A]